MNDEVLDRLDELLDRVVRIETRLSRLLLHCGLSPTTGRPLETKQGHNHERKRNPDWR